MDTNGLSSSEIETLRQDAAMGHELARIATLPGWTPIQRVTAQVLYINAHARPEFGHRIIEGKSADEIAGWIGASERTVREAMVALEGAGILQRDINRFPVNRYGAEIPRAKMDMRRGDRFQTETTIAMALELGPLPETLTESKNVKRSRIVNAKRTAEFRQLKEQLQKLLDNAPCPSCGEVGHIHIHIGATCTSCGTVLDEGEVEALAGTEIISEPDGPPNFAPEPPPANTRQALRDLKGTATTPTPSIDYKNYDEGSLTIKMPAIESEMFSPQSVGTEIISLPEETLMGAEGVASMPTTLSGVATLEYLDALGAAFCLVGGKGGIKPCDDFGAPLPGNYLDMPQLLTVAAAEVQRGGTVGLLPEHSAGLTLLDVDYGLDSLLKMWPGLARAPRVYRDNALGREKLLIAVVDGGSKIQRQDLAEPTRKAELLGRGHGNVAGVHPSGVEYKFKTGELMVFTVAQIEAMLAQWIPNPYTVEGDKRAPKTAPISVSSPTLSVDQVREAITWWNVNPANQQKVDMLLAGCKCSGKYVSMRVDDSTPSTRRTDERDGFYKRTWRDYGTQRTFDDYELYCVLKGLDKRVHKWLVVNEWREANGKMPLDLTH